MAAKHLEEYFIDPKLTRKALEEYRIFIEKKIEKYNNIKWKIENKIELYKDNILIYNNNIEENDRKRGFKKVYNELERYWSIFRNCKSYLDYEEVYNLINELDKDYSINNNKNLTNIESDDIDNIISMILKMKDIKITRNDNMSIMAISKFLHLFNPRLFLIFDGVIVQNNIKKTFKKDYNIIINNKSNEAIRRIDYSVINNNISNDISSYLFYTYWASSIIKNKNDYIIVFKEWLEENKIKEIKIDFMGNYYAFIFEVIAFGASQLEKESR